MKEELAACEVLSTMRSFEKFSMVQSRPGSMADPSIGIQYVDNQNSHARSRSPNGFANQDSLHSGLMDIEPQMTVKLQDNLKSLEEELNRGNENRSLVFGVPVENVVQAEYDSYECTIEEWEIELRQEIPKLK